MFSLLKKRRNQTILLIGFYIFFLFLRMPLVLTQGRFWAEEGNIFYANALTMNPWHALFLVYGGYLNIGANGAGLITRYLYIPLEYAPYMTTFIGLLFQLTPIYLILTAKDRWLSSFRVRILATLLLLLVPESSEISLQSLHIQFHLTLACVLIAFLQSDRHLRYFKLFLLFFVPLCGLMPFFLTLIFAITLIKERNIARLQQFIALGLGCTIQLAFFTLNKIYHLDINSISIVRNNHLSFNDFSAVLYIRDIVFLLIGHHTTSALHIMHGVLAKLQTNNISWTANFFTLFFVLTNIFIFIQYPKTQKGILLFVGIICSLCISVYGVIGGIRQLLEPELTERYTFISQALIVILILYYSVKLPNIGKYIANFFIIWLLIVGSYNFFQVQYGTYDGFGKVWRQELQKWKKDPNYHPKIWSYGWYIVLPNKDKAP